MLFEDHRGAVLDLAIFETPNHVAAGDVVC